MTPRGKEWGEEKGKGREKSGGKKKVKKKREKKSSNFLAKCRILVVDDNPLVLRVLLQVFFISFLFCFFFPLIHPSISRFFVVALTSFLPPMGEKP